MNSFGELAANVLSVCLTSDWPLFPEVDTTFGGDPEETHSEDTTRHRGFADEDLFKTPDMFVRQLESLERKTFNGADNHQNPSRKSLLRNFDPLSDPFDPSNDSFISKFGNMGLNTPDARTRFDINSHNMSVMSAQRGHNLSYIERSHNESTTLLKFGSPMPVPQPMTTTPSKKSNSNDQNDGHNQNNCDLFANDFPISDLSLQEKLIEKDKQILQLQEQLNEKDIDIQKYEVMVNLMHNLNQEIVETAAEVIDQLVAEKNELVIKFNEMNGERTHAVEELANVEKNFYEVHNRYDKARNALEEFKEKEEQFKEQIMELMDRLNEKEQMYEILKSKAEQKIEE